MSRNINSTNDKNLSYSRRSHGVHNSGGNRILNSEAHRRDAFQNSTSDYYQRKDRNYKQRNRHTYQKIPYTRNRPYFSQSLNFEKNTLKQKIDAQNDVQISLELLSKGILPEIDFERWLRKFHDLIRANSWSYDQSYLTLEVLVETELLPEKRSSVGIEKLLEELQIKCFPPIRFLELESKYQRLRNSNFQNLHAYYKKFNEYFDHANFCLKDEEKMSERERKPYFLHGLTKEEKNLYIDKNFESLYDFIEFYKTRTLKKQLYEDDREKRVNSETLKRIRDLLIKERSYIKYCPFHKVYTHSKEECKSRFHKQNNKEIRDFKKVITSL